MNSTDDQSEVVARVTTRHQLQIADGDVVLRRTSGSSGAPAEVMYLVYTHGKPERPEPFATFGHAAIKGQDLAAHLEVCLFYLESDHELPLLLRDDRPANDQR